VHRAPHVVLASSASHRSGQRIGAIEQQDAGTPLELAVPGLFSIPVFMAGTLRVSPAVPALRESNASSHCPQNISSPEQSVPRPDLRVRNRNASRCRFGSAPNARSSAVSIWSDRAARPASASYPQPQGSPAPFVLLVAACQGMSAMTRLARYGDAAHPGCDSPGCGKKRLPFSAGRDA